MGTPDLSDIQRYWFEVKVSTLVVLAMAFGYWGRIVQEAYSRKE